MQRQVQDGSAEPTLTVAAVARRLGVAPTTLRTWDRRYGLGPTARATGAHRRYTAADVARLETMRRLVLSGVTPAEAARVALATPVPTAPADGAPASRTGFAPALPPMPAGEAVQAGAAVPSTQVDAELGLEAVTPHRFAGTGGRVLSLSDGTPQARGLARAAMTLNAAGVTTILDHAVRTEGLVATWETLLRPVLVAVGHRWAQTGDGVDVEHLLSECTARVVHRQPLAEGAELSPRPALLACAPGDQHVLPLLVLAAALRGHNVDCLVLGAATPTGALREAVRRCGPAAVVLWAQMTETADVEAFEAIPRLRPPTTIIAAGQGWPARLPPGVVYATDLRHGMDLVAAAVGNR